MINITDKTLCCGCNACGDICSRKAISFPRDEEGFWYPKVDLDLCTDCGLCESVCPMLHADTLRTHGQRAPKVYGGFHKNISIRFDSTSGGAFSALANAMYKQGGYVSGAVFNEDWSVSNFISNDKKDLVRLRSSKYVESYAEGLYRQIKKLLAAGEKVLVCGAPCQMAALRTYLGKEHDNLLIVDFLCRATNSPKAYRKYLDMLEEQFGGRIVYIKAKNKDHGWRSLARKVVFDNGKVYYGEGHDDHFRRGYHGNYFERPSCYDCKFKGLPRIADITLADFWGIERIDPSIDGNLGTSMLLVNTDKGQAFLDAVKSKMELKEFDPELAFRGNRSVIMGGCCKAPAGLDRAAMFRDMDTMRFDELARKYFPEEPKAMRKKSIKDYMKHPFTALRELRWNRFNKHVSGKGTLSVGKYCAVDLRAGSKVELAGGSLVLGNRKNRKSKLETRLFLDEGAKLVVEGDRAIAAGSDVQIFRGATMKMGAGNCNSGFQVVCAEEITIGDHTYIGRDVWIRDNNGGHHIIQTGYANTAPVHIGNYVWIGSNVSIAKGVTVGDGAVISANSVVTSNVPPKAMVSGNPAVVVAEDITWVH